MSFPHPTPPEALPLAALPTPPVRIAAIEAHVLRVPIATPVRTSFGTMTDRPALLVRAVDDDGAHGWGEVWCNFPACGAEHRARLIDTVLAPLLTGRDFDSPQQAYTTLSDSTAVLAIQSGEPGPLAQAIAGIDLALWDLCARRARLPLWQLLGGSRSAVPAYASGINPDRPEATIEREHAAGHRAFKLKVGFGRELDLANVAAARRFLGEAMPLMVDANQGWTLREALAMAPALRDAGIAWLEEPLRADRPWAEWRQLAASGAPPLAAGENVREVAGFEALMASGVVPVVQPDLAKWGGISGNWPVIDAVRRAGLRYCPHYLGAGIGLLASGHVLAAAGGDGRLEIDVNPNPLRSAMAPASAHIDEGTIELGHGVGLGIDPDLTALRRLG